MTRSSAFTASLSVPERAAYVRDARTRASRSCHGWFEADADAGRTDPIEVIERQSATRLQELVPIRYGRMLESPFRFCRGAAAIMASDLGTRRADAVPRRRRPRPGRAPISRPSRNSPGSRPSAGICCAATTSSTWRGRWWAVGSVGTRCRIVLLLVRDDTDPLLLQAKDAQQSVLSIQLGGDHYDNQGRRVVSGQRLIQTTSDIFLGRTRVVGLDGRARDFYVRQLRDWKGVARQETMDPGLLGLFARPCGAGLARAHARSGDPVAIAAHLGGSDRFDRALTEFAQSYADRNERDFDALGVASHTGRVRTESL